MEARRGYTADLDDDGNKEERFATEGEQAGIEERRVLESPEPYHVIQLAARDDIDASLVGWKQKIFEKGKIFTLLSLLAIIFYLSLRILYTARAQALIPGTLWWAWIFFASEVLGFLPDMLEDMWGLLIQTRRDRPKLRLAGDYVPTIDVFVTACGEETDVIMDTVKAACAMDYPAYRFRVIVSDDGVDAELFKQVQALQTTLPNLHYYSRTIRVGVHHGFKAGNINSVMNFVDNLAGGPGEFCAVLDSDMIPEPDLLRALLAHLVNKPDMAMAVPPQRFYNIPVSDPLFQSLNLQGKTDEIGRDDAGCTWCTGSGFVYRRSAVLGIGGTPETTLAEDVMCGLMLLGQGWGIAYVHEELQWGLVPATFAGHVKQQTKWTVGALQNSIALGWCFNSPLLPRLTRYQRISGILYSISVWTSTLLKLVTLIIAPMCLLSRQTMVPYSRRQDLRALLVSVLAALIFPRINQWIATLPCGFRFFLRKVESQAWLSPYLLKAMTHELLPRRFGGIRMGFTATGSIFSDLNERHQKLRMPLFPRVKAMLMEHGVIFHLGILLIFVASVWTSVQGSLTRSKTQEDVWLDIITHALFPGLPWLQYVAFLTPITYTIWPPSMPDRRSLMVHDDSTGTFRPKPGRKMDKWNAWTWGNVACCVVPLCWATYLCYST